MCFGVLTKMTDLWDGIQSTSSEPQIVKILTHEGRDVTLAYPVKMETGNLYKLYNMC